MTNFMFPVQYFVGILLLELSEITVMLCLALNHCGALAANWWPCAM